MSLRPFGWANLSLAPVRGHEYGGAAHSPPVVIAAKRVPASTVQRQTRFVKELNEGAVISAGGWHPCYARVLLIHQLGDEAIVLVDGNGDGAEVEAENWYRDERGDWLGGSSSGVGAWDGRPIWTWGWRDGTGYVIGCAAPGRAVVVEWQDDTATAAANDLGIYVALFPGQSEPVRPIREHLLSRDASSGFRRLTPEEAAELVARRPHIVVAGDD